MIYNLFPKFQMRYEGFSIYGLRESDEGADTDLIYNKDIARFARNNILVGH